MTLNDRKLSCTRSFMNSDQSNQAITLSPWVNEPLPPFSHLLTAHDVARLTRRPRWVLLGLQMVGRFPQKRRYRGRRVGWLRADIVDWLAKGIVAELRARPTPIQQSLPLGRSHTSFSKRVRRRRIPTSVQGIRMAALRDPRRVGGRR